MRVCECEWGVDMSLRVCKCMWWMGECEYGCVYVNEYWGYA